MASFFLNRIFASALVLLAVSIAAFGLLRVSGDLASEYAGENATVEERARVSAELGLDKPLPVQFLAWASATVRGDLGRSIYTGDPVDQLLLGPLLLTGSIAGASLLLALLIGLPLGTGAAWWQGSTFDSVILAIASTAQALPGFVLAITLAAVFGISLGWLPVSGAQTPRHLVLPVIAMAVTILPALLRMVRASMIDVLAADYMELARAKGLGTFALLARHALPNASAPLIALASVQFGQLLAGSVVIEQVFAIDGMGRLALQSIERVDFPVVQGIVLVLGAAYVILTMLADLLGMLIDPRTRHRG